MGETINPFQPKGNFGLRDGHGRRITYLRLSVTDRCNLRCLYCRSNARESFILHENILRYEEMLRLVAILVRLGIGKVRLTGGEPFARKNCDRLLAMLRGHFPSLSLCVTTNGTLLEPYIPFLAKIGVGSVNLSLDSFDRQTFAKTTGRDVLPAVLASLDGLLKAGIPVKINAVAMRGINDTQLDDFVHAAKSMPVDVRFIEFMPMGSGTVWNETCFWPAGEVRAAIEDRAVLEEEHGGPEQFDGPARMFRVVGGKGRFGFISSVTNHFCRACNRLRLTSEGSLRTCLFDDEEYPLRGALRDASVTDEVLSRMVMDACLKKPVGADLLRARRRGHPVASRVMSGMGG